MVNVMLYAMLGCFVVLVLIASYVRGILVKVNKATRIVAYDHETCGLDGKVKPRYQTADGKWHDVPSMPDDEILEKMQRLTDTPTDPLMR